MGGKRQVWLGEGFFKPSLPNAANSNSTSRKKWEKTWIWIFERVSQKFRCAPSPDGVFFFFSKGDSKPGRTYNCQMLDFFFSVSVGFSLEALKERMRWCHRFFRFVDTQAEEAEKQKRKDRTEGGGGLCADERYLFLWQQHQTLLKFKFKDFYSPDPCVLCYLNQQNTGHCDAFVTECHSLQREDKRNCHRTMKHQDHIWNEDYSMCWISKVAKSDQHFIIAKNGDAEAWR